MIPTIDPSSTVSDTSSTAVVEVGAAIGAEAFGDPRSSMTAVIRSAP